jgi:hypothetical protein
MLLDQALLVLNRQHISRVLDQLALMPDVTFIQRCLLHNRPPLMICQINIAFARFVVEVEYAQSSIEIIGKKNIYICTGVGMRLLL